MGLIPYMISFISYNGMQTAMGSSKEQEISTNNCKDKGSKLTTVKTNELGPSTNVKNKGLTTLTIVKTKYQQL